MDDLKVYNAMQERPPVAIYKKAIVGKAQVIVLDPILREPRSLLLSGDGEDAQVVLWSVQEDNFFKAMNKKLLKEGVIIPAPIPEAVEEEKPIEQSSDEEIRKLINSRYLSLQAIIQKTNSEAFLMRLIRAAEEEEKSEKFLNLLRGRLAEIQGTKVE